MFLATLWDSGLLMQTHTLTERMWLQTLLLGVRSISRSVIDPQISDHQQAGNCWEVILAF